MTDPLFDLRVPPPGGLDRLARAIAQPRSHARTPRRWAWPSAAFGGACCLVLAVTLHVRDAPRRAFEAALQHALTEVQAVPVEDSGLRELPSGRADVRILLLPVQADAANSPNAASPLDVIPAKAGIQ